MWYKKLKSAFFTCYRVPLQPWKPWKTAHFWKRNLSFKAMKKHLNCPFLTSLINTKPTAFLTFLFYFLNWFCCSASKITIFYALYSEIGWVYLQYIKLTLTKRTLYLHKHMLKMMLLLQSLLNTIWQIRAFFNYMNSSKKSMKSGCKSVYQIIRELSHSFKSLKKYMLTKL